MQLGKWVDNEKLPLPTGHDPVIFVVHTTKRYFVMRQMINIREANQHLSKYIRQLQTGDELVITRRGKAVARLTPIIEKKTLNAQQSEALGRLRRLKTKAYHLGGTGIKREELYE